MDILEYLDRWHPGGSQAPVPEELEKRSKILMKRLKLTMLQTSIYDSTIMVPDDMSLENALEYAKLRLNSVKEQQTDDPFQTPYRIKQEIVSGTFEKKENGKGEEIS